MATISCESRTGLSKTDEALLDSILEWYNEDNVYITQFMSIVKRKYGMSLRIIDWLVTNYSKSHSLTIETTNIPRDLNRDYQKNLNAYNKKNMDPFARRNKITINVSYEDGFNEERMTTIGQMNFFRWFIHNKIETILQKERVHIEAHMKKSEKNSRKNTKSTKEIKSSASKAYIGKFEMKFSF